MTGLTVFLLLLVGLVAVLVGIYIYYYNTLQRNVIRINEAESEIDECLRKRYDLLVDIEKIINEATELNQNNFKDLKKGDVKISNFDFDRRLTKVSTTFNKIKQDYKVELDRKDFRNLMTELKMNEEKNEAAKSYYNNYTTKLNGLVKTFPSNIIARLCNINERLYFDNKVMTDDDILDFKY